MIGIFEKKEDGKLCAAKHVFGGEPTGIEILNFVANHYDDLRFIPAVACDAEEHKMNPKRAVREAKKSLSAKGTGTKSKQALKLQHEELKSEAIKMRQNRKNQKIAEKFTLRQQKSKKRHRGK